MTTVLSTGWCYVVVTVCLMLVWQFLVITCPELYHVMTLWHLLRMIHNLVVMMIGLIMGNMLSYDVIDSVCCGRLLSLAAFVVHSRHSIMRLRCLLEMRCPPGNCDSPQNKLNIENKTLDDL